jgi:hypothetical protein
VKTFKSFASGDPQLQLTGQYNLVLKDGQVTIVNQLNHARPTISTFRAGGTRLTSNEAMRKAPWIAGEFV